MENSEYFESLSKEDRKHYESKRTLSSGEKLPDPFVLPECEWKSDITKLPSIGWRDVTEYLIDSPSVFTRESVKAYKSLEAYNYFVGGHVQDCFYHPLSKESKFCYIRSKVLPSQRQGQKSTLYDAWVCLNKEHGWVLTGNCTCMAGLGSTCSHVAALLFKLEAAVHFKLNEPAACTSNLCSWKASRKCVQPAPISAIDFSKPKKHMLPKFAKEVLPLNRMSYTCTDPTSGDHPISNENIRELYKSYPSAAVFTSMDISMLKEAANKSTTANNVKVLADERTGSETDSDTENDTNCIPEPLTSIFDPTAIRMSDDELAQYSKQRFNIYVESHCQKAYDNLCQLTQQQTSSSIWMLHRAGRITASNCHRVSRMQESKSLVENIMQYKAPVSSKYTKYGMEMEPIARDKFETMESKNHENFRINEIGLKINADTPFLGASPDGLVHCTCHGTGVLEIKCPYTYRDNLNGWEKDPNFPIQGGNLQMKKDHPYYSQIQLQIDLCNVKFGYFFVYTSKTNEGLLSLVYRNEHFIDNLKSVLYMKFLKFILPEVVSRRMDVSYANDRKLYCICKRPEFGKMIACKNELCTIKWFHYRCVNIKRAAKGKWHCNECAKFQKKS